jgi:hypothetical protein
MERNNMADDKGFLGRWSARKVAVKEGKPVAEPAPSKHFDKLSANGLGQGTNSGAINTSGQINTVRPELVEGLSSNRTAPQAPPALTLDDVAALTPASDFSTFVAKGVDSAVKNAAMKKLFTDPHYNIMDGLDIYIGDYNTHDVLPQSVIDEMTKDGFLNMFQKDVPVEEIPAETLATSTTAKAPLDDHPDLQLQRDDAAGREGAVHGADQPPEVPAGLETAQPAVPPPSA